MQTRSIYKREVFLSVLEKMLRKRGLVVVVLALILVLAAQMSATGEGCYYYPQASEDLYCVPGVSDVEARDDCEEHAGCDFDDYFSYGSECSSAELPDCEPVKCNVDCTVKAWGKCLQEGGEDADKVLPGQEAAKCNPGCCRINTLNICDFGRTEYECKDRARSGGAGDVLFDAGINNTKCVQDICRRTAITGNLTINVKNANGIPVSATVSLEGSGILPQTGPSVTFSNIPAQTYSVKITAADYLTDTLSITLLPGENKVHNVTLRSGQGQVEITGTVTSGGTPLDGATITYSGPLRGTVVTDTNGDYVISGLVPGDYTLTAGKINFRTSDPQLVNIIIGETIDHAYFILTEAPVNKIAGTIYVDDNPADGICAEGEKRYGVRLYLDGNFKGYSRFTPTGSFEIQIDEVNRVYELSATYGIYSGDKSVQVGGPGTIDVSPFCLKKHQEICGPNNLAVVQNLAAQHIPGVKAVKLEWTKPCPEVTAYEIWRDGTRFASASPAESSFIDDKVAWDKTYKYTIKAVYGLNPANPSSEVSITLGNPLCEGKFHGGQADLFCLKDGQRDRKVWQCDEFNKLTENQDCFGISNKNDYFCSRTSEYSASCKSEGPCVLGGGPLGVYYNKDNCYGPENINACFFDTSSSITDICQGCSKVQTCFDYTSEDACTVNNCLTDKCSWMKGAANDLLVDYSQIGMLPLFLTPETGRGYCVPENYKKDDQCSLCGPKVTLFENYFCTADVCSGLGRCFSGRSEESNQSLSSCHACGLKPKVAGGTFGEEDSESNCYAYQTKAECTGSPGSFGTESDSEGNIITSQDTCEWQRCSWRGAANFDPSGSGCMKDGDANQQDDCAIVPGLVHMCKVDVAPPTTSIYPTNITPVISQAYPNITFKGVDNESNMGTVHFCLISADPLNPQICQVEDYARGEAAYIRNKKSDTVSVDLLNSDFLKGITLAAPEGEPFRLKYYSLDQYFNQENPRQTFVFVDNVPPAFNIIADILTVEDKTNMRIYLVDTIEPMNCSFVLSQIFPRGQNKTTNVGRQERNKGAEFKNLQGVRFDLKVTCVDDNGNANSKVENYVFDVSGKVKIVSPAGPTTATEISFRIKTAVGATCDLYHSETNEKIAAFASDEIGKEHYTEPLPGFIEGKYPAAYKAVCQELFPSGPTPESFEGYFNFEIDLTPPTVQIVLKEGSRTRKPLLYGWEEGFINSTQVSFECTGEGFNCTNTYYCLGDGCEMIAHAPYQTYSVPFTVASSKQICYYATDSGNNTVYSPLCGDIKIEGFGITLEKPSLHYYHEKQWGVSNKPEFDWQFYTKIPTEECRFDFRPNFNYSALPEYKILNPNLKGKYLVSDFPQRVTSPYDDSEAVKTLYVRCQNLDGMLSPEQEMNLEYDPTAPEIDEAYAQPDEVFEGTTTQLFVVTDDKTLCKYDNQSGEFETMNYKFPGFDEKELDENHESRFYVGATGENGVTNYNLKTQCSNGAGDLSEVKEISFMVDYSSLGYIIPSSLKPKGYVTSRNTTLEADTNKQASCTYHLDEPAIPFQTTGSLQHRQVINDLAEGDYNYVVSCRMQENGHKDQKNIKFTVDYSPPVINKTDDNNFTCGEDIQVFVYTNEESISSYYYELYDAGLAVTLSKTNMTTSSARNNTNFRINNATNNSANIPQILPASSNLILVANRTVAATQPLVISASNLTIGNRYVIKIKAEDGVGFTSAPATSDGVIVVKADYPACTADKAPPRISIARNDFCASGTSIELHCSDATGCKNLRYGTSLVKSCNITQNYNGQKISLTRTSWLCYSVEDNVGNKENSTSQVVIADKDGDSVTDTCDQCKDTKPGKVVDVKGCANGEVPAGEQNDTDGDGLADYWEQSYNDLGCVFNHTSRDSDEDGVYDALADYDSDGFTNYEEFISGTDPCGGEEVPDYDASDIEEGGSKNTTFDFRASEPKAPASTTNVLAWTLLIIGLLLVIGGSGYLIYFYQQKSPPRNNVSKITATLTEKPASIPSTINSLKGRFEDWRKEHIEKQQSKQRSAVFGAFTPESAQIPHVTEALKMKAPHLDKLQELAQRYADHKNVIQPGLKPEEKGVFSKLDTIAKQMKNKEIGEVVTKDEAKDIFSQLRNLSDKREKQ